MPDALSRMGLSRRPELEFFKFPKGMANDPSYSQEFRADLREDQDIQRQQRILDMQDREIAQQERAQRAVNQFTRQDPSTRQQFLEENADIALSPQFGRLAQQQSLATRTLAPSLARKLPPAAARRFYENVDQGMEANDAFEEARDFLEQESYRERLAPFASDDEIKQRFPEGRFSAPEVARFEAEQKRKLGQDPGIELARDYYMDLTRKARMEKDSAGIVSPETEAKMARVLDEIEQRTEAWRKSRATPATGAAVVTPTPTVTPAPGVGAAPAPLKDTLKGISGKTPAATAPVATTAAAEPELGPLPEEVEAQVMEHAASPEADENFFTAAVSNPKLSDAVRKDALEKFRAFVKNPPLQEGRTIGESLARQQRLRDQLAKAEKDFDFVPELGKANEAWTVAKGGIDKAIDDFAKSLGVGKSQVVASLLQDEKIPVPGREKEYTTISGRDDVGADQGIPVRKLLGEFMGGPSTWSKTNPVLEPLTKSKFADRLGTKTAKTYGDVLQAYLDEKSAGQPRTPVAEKPATEEKLPEPKTLEEAKKLPPGTKFKTPDGRIAIVPPKKP